MAIRCKRLTRSQGRCGLNAKRASEVEQTYDPRELIRTVKKLRDRSARIDAFSDGYIWVLLAVVALVYLFSALSGVIFALQGAAGNATRLPSAVWDLQELTVALLPVMLLSCFRGLLYLGPCGLRPDKAAWWLPLAVDLRGIRKRSFYNALILGALLNSFIGILWLAGLFTLSGRFEVQVFFFGLVFFAVTGTLLSAIATHAQIAAQARVVRRICRLLLTLFAMGLSISWSLLLTENAWAQGAYGLLGDLAFDPGFWASGCVGALLLATIVIWQATRKIDQVKANSLRLAGQKQNELVGSLAQMELSGMLPATESVGPRSRNSWHRPLRHLPVVLQILLLRYLRGGYWRAPGNLVLLTVALVLAVRSIANPLAVTGFFVLLLWVLTESFGRLNRPLASAPGLAQMLSQPRTALVRPAIGFTLCMILVILSICSLLPLALGMIPTANLGFWVLGVLVAASGTSAAAWGRATRGERDWEALILGASNEINTGSLMLIELRYFLQAVASGLPLILLLLTPISPVPWGIWAFGLLCAYPGYAARRRAGESATSHPVTNGQ